MDGFVLINEYGGTSSPVEVGEPVVEQQTSLLSSSVTIQPEPPVSQDAPAKLEQKVGAVPLVPSIPSQGPPSGETRQKVDVQEFLQPVFQQTTITGKSPISVLRGITDICVDALEKQAGITDLELFSKLKQTDPRITFLVDTGIQPNIHHLLENAILLLEDVKQVKNYVQELTFQERTKNCGIYKITGVIGRFCRRKGFR